MACLLHPSCSLKRQQVPRVFHRTLAMLSTAPLSHQGLHPGICTSIPAFHKGGADFGRLAAVPQSVPHSLCYDATRISACWGSSQTLLNGGHSTKSPNILEYSGILHKSKRRVFGPSPSSCLVAARNTTASSVSESLANGEVADRIRHEVDVRDTVPPQEVAGNVVCLGKFDALHLGHRALAERGASIGPVYMLSFSNMAEVLGWEPRLPLLASSNRPAVLRQWASVCGGVAPKEVLLDFQNVRRLSPEAFVDLLADQLKVKGVVAGDNYRFGFKAAGDAAALQTLGEARGLEVAVVGSVTDCGPHCAPSRCEQADRMISSTRVRRALGQGDLECVAQLLGRRHQLALWIPQGTLLDPSSVQGWTLPRSCLLNEPPCPGTYEALASILPADIRDNKSRQESNRKKLHSLKEETFTVEVLIEDEAIRVLSRVDNGGQKARGYRTPSGPHVLNLELVKGRL